MDDKICEKPKSKTQTVGTAGLAISCFVAILIMCGTIILASWAVEGYVLDPPEPPQTPDYLAAVITFAIGATVSALPIAGFICLLKKKKIPSVLLLSVTAAMWTAVVIFLISVGAFTDDPKILLPIFGLLIIPLIVCCVCAIAWTVKKDPMEDKE